jgi:hypothetical protein
MPVVSITTSVMLAKIKPTNFSPLWSAMLVPQLSQERDQKKMDAELASAALYHE